MAKILIVDDDTAMAAEVAGSLKQRGHVCGVHARGERVIDIVRKEDVDLLVLDIMLPGPSGFQVCREIRSDDNLYTLPIIFLSAMDHSEEVQHGLDQGADSYVTKPFNMNELVQRVESLLQARQGTDMVDAVTSMPNSEGTRKGVQQHLSRGEAFGLAYIEMLNFRDFTGKVGVNGQQKALRHLARAIRAYVDDMDAAALCTTGHLGGGYFIVVLSQEEIQPFCKRLLKGWKRHKQNLMDSCDLSPQDAAAAISQGWLDLCLCVTARDSEELLSVNQLLDTVSGIRETVPAEELAGIHLDRRLG